MNFFDEATLRLKQELRMSQDQEVASVLGLSARAWVGRKKRGSFPETELLALKGRRPDLNLDVGYVLTGERPSERLRATADLMRARADRMLAFTPPGDEELVGLAAEAIKRMARLQGDRAPIYANFLERLNYCSEEQIDLLSLLVDQLVLVGSRELPDRRPTGRTGADQTFHGAVGTAVHGDVTNLTTRQKNKSSDKP